MRKLGTTILILLLLVPMLIVPDQVEAKTLGDLKKELAAAREKYNNAQKEEEETNQKIETNNASIDEIEKKVAQMEKDVATLSNEIKELDKKIKAKDKEIKNVMNFVQVSSGESAYLEYAFGAKDFTDFIYRVSVSEQLANYNEQLIADFEKMIQQNKDKQVELNKKSEELAKEKERLRAEVAKLGERLNEISFIKMDANEEIELQEEAIKTLENMGCKDNENIKTCGRDTLPSDTSFWRPITSGYVTSEYGYRCLDPLGCALHEAIDVTNSNRTVPIYAAANGTVIGIRKQSSCGGNMIFILHTINGVKYTTEYAHLRTIDVYVGQVVTKNTQIATMGGDPATEWWDSCSPMAQHLHFGIAKGHYLKDYMSWSQFIGNTFDPRQIVNFPYTGGATDYFADRITKY